MLWKGVSVARGIERGDDDGDGPLEKPLDMVDRLHQYEACGERSLHLTDTFLPRERSKGAD